MSTSSRKMLLPHLEFCQFHVTCWTLLLTLISEAHTDPCSKYFCTNIKNIRSTHFSLLLFPQAQVSPFSLSSIFIPRKSLHIYLPPQTSSTATYTSFYNLDACHCSFSHYALLRFVPVQHNQTLLPAHHSAILQNKPSLPLPLFALFSLSFHIAFPIHFLSRPLPALFLILYMFFYFSHTQGGTTCSPTSCYLRTHSPQVFPLISQFAKQTFSIPFISLAYKEFVKSREQTYSTFAGQLALFILYHCATHITSILVSLPTGRASELWTAIQLWASHLWTAIRPRASHLWTAVRHRAFLL